MDHYATVHACRRKQLLNYFGEAYEHEPCPDCCDICVPAAIKFAIAGSIAGPCGLSWSLTRPVLRRCTRPK